MAENSLTCLLMYHRQDREIATRLKGILEQRSIICQLLYEVVGADIHTDTFRCADSADCVISLITQILFIDEKCRLLHEKVYWRLGRKKFVAVKMDIDDEAYNSPAFGFLEGCHVLAPEEMSDFEECLVNEIHAVVRKSPNEQQISYKANSEPLTYSETFQKTNIDNEAVANNLASSETMVKDVSQLFLSHDTPAEILKGFEKCLECYTEFQQLKDSAHKKAFEVNILRIIKLAVGKSRNISLRDKQLKSEPMKDDFIGFEVHKILQQLEEIL